MVLLLRNYDPLVVSFSLFICRYLISVLLERFVNATNYRDMIHILCLVKPELSATWLPRLPKAFHIIIKSMSMLLVSSFRLFRT